MSNVAILVNNPGTVDSRVVKNARSTKSAGYSVCVFGRKQFESSFESEEVVDGCLYRRLNVKYSVDLLKDVLRVVFNEKSLTFGLPVWIVLIIGILLAPPVLAYATVRLVFRSFFSVFRIKGDIQRKYPRFFWTSLYCFHERVTSGYSKIINRIARIFIQPIMMLEYLVATVGQIEAFRPDIVYCNDLDTLLAGVYVSRKRKVPVIYDSHELERDRNDRKGFWVRFIIKACEDKVVRDVSFIVTVSQGIAEKLHQFYPDKEILVVHNVPEKLEETYKGTTVRRLIGLSDDKFLAVYVGLITLDRCLEEIVGALCYLPADVHIAFIGPSNSPSFKELLTKRAAALGVLSRLHIISPVPAADVPYFIEDADLGLLLAPNICASYNFSMPNKLFEMTLAGVPILHSNLASISDFVEKQGVGLVLEDPLTDSRIASKIDELYRCGIKRMEFEALKEMRNKLCWENEFSSVIRLYQRKKY
ncbi:glycosyltransferase [Thalassospira sp.]|uniref:glycosyltransferase n=1 Tax=Thalassospira sp. TaxID=1912094 RepID=UPI000C651E6E|nr:glycosyltransferase [Thalassospira sp.]MAL41050.1 hypothetical protein [Thalassospira sp.]|tara:strand:- start:3983 stop:5407 length:1425 start_codon:yes stop_codon:yes gene_type:complete